MMYDFISRKGLVAVVGMRPHGSRKVPHHIWVDMTKPKADEELSGTIEYLQQYKNCEDIYWSEASFKFRDGEEAARTADKAVSFRCYAMDVDCNGKDPEKAGEWETPNEALAHISKTLNEIGLPPSNVVFSGRGLQFIWNFTTEVKPDAWLDMAEHVWSIAEHFGFRADSTRRRDRASIFRMPETVNSKSGLKAKIIVEDEPYRPADFMEFLDQIIKEYEIPPAIVLTRDDDEQNDYADGTVENHPQNEERLQFLLNRIPSHFTGEVGRSGSVRRSGYEMWRSVIWAAKRTGLPNARRMAYAWAMGAENKYDDLAESFDRTWDSDNLEKGQTTGPGTLVYMADRFAPASKRAGLSGFHFLDAEELRALDGLGTRETVVPKEYYCDPFGFLLTIEDDAGIEADEKWKEELGRYPDLSPDPEDGDFDIPENVSGSYAEEFDDADADTVEAPEKDEDEEEEAFLGPIHLAPPGKYGGPKGELPFGFLPNPNGPGFGTLVKVQGLEGEDVKEFKLLCSCHLELIESNLSTSADGFNERYTYVFRKYHERTGKPESPFHVKGSDLTDKAALMRILGDAGLLLSMDKDVGQKMSRYMQALIRKRREEMKEIPIIHQAGWFREETAFALGEAIVAPSGKSVVARVDPAIGAALRGLGQRKGSLECQQELLAPFGEQGCEQQAALISLFLGSPIARFAPNPGGVVWVHTPQSGVGKTHLFDTANGLFGNPRGLLVNGKSTLPYFTFTQVSRNDVPTYIDELEVGSGPNDKVFQQMKSFLLHASQGVDRGKMKQGGTSAAGGDKEWNAPLFITTNAPFDYVVTDNGPSTEGTYARGLVVPFRTKRLYPSPMVAGVDWTVAVHEHYGHIGPQFLAYATQHKDEIRLKVNQIYRELQDKSAAAGMDKMHRFHNSTIACGMIALEWLERSGMAKGWDFAALREYLPKMAYSSDENVKSIASNDPANVWTDFLIQNQNNIIRQAANGDRMTVPDDLTRNRMGIVIRMEHNAAFVKSIVLRRYCTQRGVAFEDVHDWLRQTYDCSAQTLPKEMSAGTQLPRQPVAALMVRRDAIEDRAPVPMDDESKVVSFKRG